MTRTTTVCVFVWLAFSAAVFAQGQSTTNQGSTPNGRPFQEIQSQFSAIDEQLQAMNQQIQALQTQVNGIEANLQSQFDAINATLVDLQAQVDDLNAASSSFEARIMANEAAIDALEAAVADLQLQLAAAQAALAAQTGDISALQNQVNNIQLLINSHTSQITSLQQQINGINQFLANLVNGNCQAGQAIQDIAPGGFIVCTQAGGNTGSLQTFTTWAGYHLNFGHNSGSINCPSGYSATGSGYSAPAWYDNRSYVNGVSYSWSDYGQTEYEYFYNGAGGNNWYSYWDPDRVTFPYAYYSYFYSSPTSVTTSYSFPQTAFVSLLFTPQYYYTGNYFYVYVNCARVQ